MVHKHNVKFYMGYVEHREIDLAKTFYWNYFYTTGNNVRGFNS